MSEERYRPAAATFSDLVKKRVREASVTVPFVDDDGTAVELVMRYRAIGSLDYDDLIAAHPPTAKQKAIRVRARKVYTLSAFRRRRWEWPLASQFSAGATSS